MSYSKSTGRSKLASLFALGGAVFAVPHTGQAQITSQTLNVNVGFGAGDVSAYTIDTPGQDILSFVARIDTSAKRVKISPVGTGFYAVLPGYKSGTYFAIPAAAGQHFSGIPAGLTTRQPIVASSARGPASYSHQYLAFKFTDTSDANKLKYGWVQLSTTRSATPSITLEGWAIQNDGTQILMGAVPEPQAAALATGAALILGAAGLRAWRRRRATPAAI